MADNYLITGYWGEPHVTAENDRGINAAMFGTGKYVLPVGRRLWAEYIGNNTIRLYDGKLVDNGAVAGIPAGEHFDLLIANAGQGKKRNDLIVFEYSQDSSTLIESGTFKVIQGTETTGTATDPELTEADLLSGKATKDQMALYRVSVSGATIAAPVKMYEITRPLTNTAPSGYGLGTVPPTIVSLAELNAATNNGWYRIIGGSVSIGGTTWTDGWVEVTRYNEKYCTQRIYPLSNRNLEIARRNYDGTWVDEWVNPPMNSGVEYRTTERDNGQTVYAKRVSHTISQTIGNASGVSIVNIPHNISGLTGLVRCIGRYPASKYQLPYIGSTGGITVVNGVNASSIVLRLKDMTWDSGTFEFDIYYTK